MLEYFAAYQCVEDGWYLAEVVDFPGVVSQGKTLHSARRMVRDALRVMAELRLERGEALPKPNPRARSKKADYTERIPLKVRAQCGAVK
jgi:predicted RNase H-like HicB family nuclease